MNYLLDTCVICEMMKKRPDEKVVKWFCKQEQKSLYLSYLTIGEIQKVSSNAGKMHVQNA